MLEWPNVTAPGRQISTKKGKKSNQEPAWKYPSIGPGLLGSACLARTEGDQFHWTFAGPEGRNGRRLRPNGNASILIPNQRSVSCEVEFSAVRQAEQGAHFLRTCYPDVDISAELIREELAQDLRHARSLRDFDPDEGELLNAFSTNDGTHSTQYVAYASGKLGRDLCISPFLYVRGRVRLPAFPGPTAGYSTPIQQISTRRFEPHGDTDTHEVLGIRTYGEANLLRVKPKASVRSAPHIDHIAALTRKDVGDKPIIDISISSGLSGQLALLVNTNGAIYECQDVEGSLRTQIVHASPLSAAPAQRAWRLRSGSDDVCCLLMSSTSVRRVDIRDPRGTTDLHSASRPGELFMDIEYAHRDGFLQLATDTEVLWFDERCTGKPLLGVKHFRGCDRTLGLCTRRVEQASLTFLFSRRNRLVSVYDVSSAGDDFSHLHVPPYGLPAGVSMDGRNVGRVFLNHRGSAGQAGLSIVQMAESGSISVVDYELAGRSEDSDVGSISDYGVKPSNNADAEEPPRSQKIGHLSARTYSEVDLRIAYERIFSISDNSFFENADAVYDVIDKLPAFLQESDIPLEQMLTTYDIAFRSETEPGGAARSDFLSDSAIVSVRGYRALMQERIPLNQLIRRSPWHMNLTRFLQRSIADVRDHPNETLVSLKRYDLSSDTDLVAPAIRRQNEVREQLLLDLSLAADVFSPLPFSKAWGTLDPDLDAALETMSRATEAMSLGETPPLRFGFLRPVDKKATNHYSRTTDSEMSQDLQTTAGVRLLLGEWEIGTNPDTYTYEDPYADSSQPRLPQTRPRHAIKAVDISAREIIFAPQRPPTVVAASQRMPPPIMTKSQPTRSQPANLRPDAPPASTQSPVAASSQPADDMAARSPSQAIMPSTQVLPGPHGGRPVKKKPAKKRMGGF